MTLDATFDKLRESFRRCLRLTAPVCILTFLILSTATATSAPTGDDDAFIRQHTFDRSAFGTSTLPIWYALTDFERMALGRRDAAKAGDPQALLALAIMASGDERSMASWERYRDQVERFVRRITPAVDQAPGQKIKAHIIFREMCTAFLGREPEKEELHGFDVDQSQLTELLRSKRYNCVSSALLYLVCARYFGLNVKGVTIPSHIFVQLETETGEKIDIETTSTTGFGVVHDRAFYEYQSAEWYKQRKMTRSTWQEYQDRKIIEPYQVVALNMSNQHTIEQRMHVLDISRLAEASGYLNDTDVLCVFNRVHVYVNEYVYFDRVGDSLTMLRMFSRVGDLVHDLKRSWAHDTLLIGPIADFLRHQYHALLRNGREPDALALLPDAMELLKTGETPCASMMTLIDRITANHIARLIEQRKFEQGIAFLDNYAPFMRPGNDLMNSRALVLYHWATSLRKGNERDSAVALYMKALAAAGDAEMAGKIRHALVSASIGWSRQLVDSKAWKEALTMLERAGSWAVSAEDRRALADDRVYVHESWAQATYEQKQWSETLARLRIALAEAGTSGRATRIKDNIAGVHLHWMNELWDTGAWQQIVEMCSTAQAYAHSEDLKKAARENLATACVNWARELALEGAWEAAIRKLRMAGGVATNREMVSQCALGLASCYGSWGDDLFDERQWLKAGECYLMGLRSASAEESRGPLRDNFHRAYMSWSRSPSTEQEKKAWKKMLQQFAGQCADCTWCKVELKRLARY